MHACGRNARTTMLLGAAKLLNEPKDRLKRKAGAGASHMIKDGALGDAEALFGMHDDDAKSTESTALVPGPLLAAGPVPHSTVYPILAASFAIWASQQLTFREADPLHSQVLSVTFIRGGSALNVIPPYVEFGGTLRSLSTEGLHNLQQRYDYVVVTCNLLEVIEGQAAIHR